MAVNSLQGATDPISKGIVNAKGDLIVGTADNTIDRLQIGVDNSIATANSSTDTGIEWTNLIISPRIKSFEEIVNISNTSATGTINYDVLTSTIWYYTSNASGNWTLNIRGNSSTTLNSLLSIGDSISLSFIVTQGSSAYYQTGFQIDESSITPKWAGGTAPTSGNANGIDLYSFSIIKTGENSYLAIASQTGAT